MSDLEWQSIETAPKDGTVVLVLNQNGMSIASWSDQTRGPGVSGHVQLPGWVCWANGREVPDEGWDTGHGFTLWLTGLDEPTHWMISPALAYG